ncbi:MAG: HupE/UreJ family protein [Sinimarinibacterium sp.]|jgi:hypothetical protein
MSRLVLVLVAWLWSVPALAHTMNSAQWQLTQRDAQTWESRLRLPEDLEGRLLSLQPRWPDDCARVDEPRLQPAQEGTVMAWTLRCRSPLRGALGLSGFSVQLPDAVLLIQPLHGAAQYAVLSTQRPQWVIDADAKPAPSSHYLALGVEHIVLGADHLLFVLGLWALWRRSGRPLSTLIGTLTAFTVAHSITLAGAVLGGWTLPTGAVEACIAASILLLAVEWATGEGGGAQRRPASVAFAFGLLHGFGFAGALAQTGLPEQARGWALAAFNVGVETGQLLFVVALFGLAWAAKPARRWAPAALAVYGAVAAYWLIERSAAVFA